MDSPLCRTSPLTDIGIRTRPCGHCRNWRSNLNWLDEFGAARSKSIANSRYARFVDSRHTEGVTRLKRIPSHDSNRIDFQIPQVGSAGPQSQPKLQAILRMKLKGPATPLTRGRSPSLSRIISAYLIGEEKVMTRLLDPRRSALRTSKR